MQLTFLTHTPPTGGLPPLVHTTSFQCPSLLFAAKGVRGRRRAPVPATAPPSPRTITPALLSSAPIAPTATTAATTTLYTAIATLLHIIVVVIGGRLGAVQVVAPRRCNHSIGRTLEPVRVPHPATAPPCIQATATSTSILKDGGGADDTDTVLAREHRRCIAH